jgi:glycosyltransferase involved in cell wall biosynthesis
MLFGQFNDSFPPQTDGVAQTTINYTKWLNKDGNYACAVVPSYKNAKDDYPFKVIRYPSVPLPVKMDYKIGMPHFSPKIMTKLDKLPFSLVHAHCPFTSGIIALRMARKRKIPVVATFHTKFADDFIQRTGIKTSGKIAAEWTAQFYHFVDEVWAVNHGTAKTLWEYGYEGDIRVMPNGCDFERIEARTMDMQAKLKQTYHLGNGPIFVFVGRMVQQKNPDVVLRVVERLKAQGKMFSLLMVGDGEEIDKLKALSVKLNISDRVVFTGQISDRLVMRDIFSGSDILVFPSIYDNAPLVVREAAACECPALLIEGSNSSEGIMNQENGFLTKLDEVEIAQCLAVLIDSPELLRACGKQASQSVYLSWETVVKQARGEYDRIMQEHIEKRFDNFDKKKRTLKIK